jgi:hypothetical protein
VTTIGGPGYDAQIAGVLALAMALITVGALKAMRRVAAQPATGEAAASKRKRRRSGPKRPLRLSGLPGPKWLRRHR